jgi:hypothetical protein
LTFHRLLPVYGYMMLLDATLLVHIHDGPVWPKAAETQKYFCRNNWWANVLFINNYVETSEPVRGIFYNFFCRFADIILCS